MRRMIVLAAALSCATSASAAPGIRLIPIGEVEVRGGPAAQWRPVAQDENLSAGQEIRTRNGSAEVRFPDGSIVRLNRDTVFAIDRTDSREAAFSLKLGKLKAAFAGLFSSRVSIRTPTAVCAVRGTVFELGADADATQVRMAEGVLEIQDNKGKQAVVTSEEIVKIGRNGLEAPRIIGLNDPSALQAVRPYQVHQETARDATRAMLEDIHNRELKANEAQLGKDVVDAFGRRVRLEEYLLRPDTKSFKILFLSRRQDRFDWGHLIETFNTTIPDDMSKIPAIIQGTFLSASKPANWLKSMEFYATNTVDADKERVVLGDPVQIDFSGFGKGSLWYPSSIDFTQTLSGPGVPGGSRVQFAQHQDWNTLTPGRFTWYQNVQPNATTTNSPQTMFIATLDPTSATDVAAGATTAGTPNINLYTYTNTTVSYPSGPTKADVRQTTVYSDNASLTDSTSVTVEKFLVSNEGRVLDFANATSDSFAKDGSYNVEINIKSSLFQGRDIDVLIAPEILRQKSQQTATGKNIVR